MDINGISSTTKLMTLTGDNFTEFERAFKLESLNVKGKAGEIIMKNDMVTEQDPTALGNVTEAVRRKYEDFVEGKKKLVAMLMTHLSVEIQQKVMAKEGYEAALASVDLYTLWKLVREVAEGKGNASTLSAVRKLMGCKQVGKNIYKYKVDFIENAARLKAREGDKDKLIEVMLTSLFVAGLNQKQFEQPLVAVYSSQEWPNYIQLADQLVEYDDSVRRREQEGITTEEVVGNQASQGRGYGDNRDRQGYRGRDNRENRDNRGTRDNRDNRDRSLGVVCYNCGVTGHYGSKCTRPPCECNQCHRIGHMAKFCGEITESIRKRETLRSNEGYQGKGDRNYGGRGQTDRRQSYDRKDSYKGNRAKGNQNKKSSGKTTQGRKVMQKAIARLAEAFDNWDDDNSEDEGTDDQGGEDYVSESDDGYESEEVNGKVAMVCEEEAYELHANRGSVSKGAVLDTGCSGAHLMPMNYEHLLQNHKDSNKVVKGVGGVEVAASSEGTLGKLGRTLILKDAKEGLLSVSKIMESIEGSYLIGNLSSLAIRTKDHELLLKADNDGTGTWRVPPEEVLNFMARVGQVQGEGDDELEGEDLDDVVVEGEERRNTLEPVVPKILNADDMQRAKYAYDLCQRTNHAGPHAIRTALRNDCYVLENKAVTVRDFENGLELFGPCQACLQGKMRADPTPQKSSSPPAVSVGQVVHCDILPLPAIGRGTVEFALFGFDERSGFVDTIGMKGKDEADLRRAFVQLISRYREHDHEIKRIQVDHESNLLSLQTFLSKNYNIRQEPHPAGDHEKMAERNIQTFKGCARAMAAGLPYALESLPQLSLEWYIAAAYAMNVSPRKRTGGRSPMFLMTGRKPVLMKHGFGTIGLLHKRSQVKTGFHSVYGIYLAPDRPHMHGSRVYLPATNSIVTGKKFAPSTQYPKEWNLRPREFVSIVAPAAITTSSAQEKRQSSGVQVDVQSNAQPVRHGVNSEADQLAGKLKGTSKRQPKGNSQVVVTKVTWPNEKRSLDSPDTHSEAPMSQGPVVIRDQKGESASLVPAIPVTQYQSVRKGATATYLEALLKAKSSGHEQPDRRGVTVPPPPPEPPPIVSQRPMRSVAKKNWQQGPAKGRQASVLGAAVAAMGAKEEMGFVQLVQAFRMSLKKAMKEVSKVEVTRGAVKEEIDNLESNDVAEFVHRNDIPRNVQPINAHIFITDKFDGDGVLTRRKARVVVNGNEEDDNDVGDTFSPTVNPISVFTQLNVTVNRGNLLSAYDIKGAFLLTPVDKTKKKIYLRIPPDVAEYWVQFYPKRRRYLNRDGCMFILLNKYLYGLQESPHEFNLFLHNKLLDMNFKRSRADKCIYTREVDGGLMMLSAHVDDILLSSPSKSGQSWFERQMEKSFQITKQYNDVSYLGMSIKYDMQKKILKVSQVGAVKDIVNKLGLENLRSYPKTPACSEKLLGEHLNSPLCNKSEYLSLVMSMMYFARLTRPDILMPVTALATRCSNPTLEDFTNLRRIVRYLGGTTEVGIVFDGRKELRPAIYADASHNIHTDGRGHAGIIMTLGSAPILCRSYKIKLVTRSSTESELFALEEATTYSGWLRVLLHEFGVDSSRYPIPTYQDNKSTIIVASTGANFKRFKHIIVREAFVQERVERGDIVLKYLATNVMPADMLTKPLGGTQLSRHMTFLGVYI